MSSGWIIAVVAALLLIVVAAIAEAVIKRNTKRPLSSHAVRKRRWDDPAIQHDKDINPQAKWHDMRTGADETKSWKVSLDPQHQSKALMPRNDKGKRE